MEKEKVVGKRSEKRGYIETVRKVSKNQFDVGAAIPYSRNV